MGRKEMIYFEEGKRNLVVVLRRKYKRGIVGFLDIYWNEVLFGMEMVWVLKQVNFKEIENFEIVMDELKFDLIGKI